MIRSRNSTCRGVPGALGGFASDSQAQTNWLSRAWDVTLRLLERNAEFGKAPAWPPGIPSWPPALGGGDGVCPGEPAVERTAGAALDEPVRSRVTPRGRRGLRAASSRWPQASQSPGGEGSGVPTWYPGSCRAHSTVSRARGACLAKAHLQRPQREGLGRWAAAAGPGRGRACTGRAASWAQSRGSGRPCTAQSPGHVPSPLRSLSRPSFSPPPAALSPRSVARRLRPSKKLAARGCNCTTGEITIAGALGVARGGQAMRVAPQRVDGGKQEAFVCSSPPRGANYSVPVSPLGGLGS